jgi:hypothetical protein
MGNSLSASVVMGGIQYRGDADVLSDAASPPQTVPIGNPIWAGGWRPNTCKPDARSTLRQNNGEHAHGKSMLRLVIHGRDVVGGSGNRHSFRRVGISVKRTQARLWGVISQNGTSRQRRPGISASSAFCVNLMAIETSGISRLSSVMFRRSLRLSCSSTLPDAARPLLQ